MMPLSLSFRAQLLFLAVSFLAVYGQDQTGRLDVLKGTNGQNACDLKDAIHLACSPPPSPALNVAQTPSLCTCNNVFFNIWSACSFASGNNTLPMFSLWNSMCTAANISLGASVEMKQGGGSMMGIAIPVWADIPVPGNTAFDLQQAVVLSQQLATRKTWTIIQIVLPIVSAFLAALLTVVFLKLRSNRLRSRRPYTPTPTSASGKSKSKSRISVPSFPVLSRMLHPSRRVRNLDQRSLSGWMIDEPTTLIAPPPSLDSGGASTSNVNMNAHVNANGGAHAHDPAVAIPPSPPDTPHRESTVPGHPSEYSDTPRQSVAAHESMSLSVPASVSTRGLYPFSREEQERMQRAPPLRSGPGDLLSGLYVHPATTATNSNSNSNAGTGANTGANTPGTSTPRTWGSSIRDVRLPYPFRKRPVQIVSTEPTERFRIDGSSEGAGSVRESLIPAPRGTGRVTPRDGGGDLRIQMGQDEYDAGLEGDDQLNEGFYGSAYEDEGTNLITEDERRDSSRYSEVNSRTTHGTSINSKIKIESPTASTVSPRSSMPGTAGIWPLNRLSSKPSQPLPVLPPVPRLPAPLPPPAAPRTSPRGQAAMDIASGSGLRVNSPPLNNTRMMSPIPEDQHSIRAVNRPRQLNLPPQELPMAVTSIAPSSSSGRPVPNRSASGDSDLSVHSSRRPLPSPALSSSSSTHQHQRSTSSSASARGPLPDTPPLYFNNLNNAHRRSGSGSNNSASSIQRTISPPPSRDLFDDPLFMPHRRGLSADDASSFYLTADPPTLIQRSGTPQSMNQSPSSGSGSGARMDPAAFFPGAVRGAGYGS